MSAITVIENTFFANGRYWGGLNASLYKSGPISVVKTGVESDDLNWIWNEEPLTPEDAQSIRQIQRYVDNVGLPFWWWIFPSAKTAETTNQIKAAGYSFVLSVPCMLADLNFLPNGESRDMSITVSRVSNKEDLALWRDVSFAGFDFPPHVYDQYDRFTASFNLAPDAPQKFFLAFESGKPVATSLLFLSDNAAGIYFITTLAEHRQKGIGLELTRSTMRCAKRAGARFATLQSSPEGFHVYERAGFKEFCRVDVYGSNVK